MKNSFLCFLTISFIISIQPVKAAGVDSKIPILSAAQATQLCNYECGVNNWSESWTCDRSKIPSSYKGCLCACKIDPKLVPLKFPPECVFISSTNTSITLRCYADTPAAPKQTTVALPCSHKLLNCGGEAQCTNACASAP
jgi:hypothetical protein